MKDLMNRILSIVKALFSLFKVKSRERKLYEAEINRAVERLIDQVNPRLRAVSGYRKRLFPVVEGSLEYSRGLAAQTPGPVQVDRKSWATDPYVNALFGGVKRIRWVLSGPEVRKYVKARPLGADCYAVLASMPDVRNQLGMELKGEHIQRDVRQTTVSFSDHEVGDVGESEEEVRRILGGVAHDVLVGIAVQDIVARESNIGELEERLRVVRLKRRVAQAGSRGAALILDGSATRLAELEALDSRIAVLEKELAEAKQGMEGLDDYLDRLIELLEHPRNHLRLEEVKVRLDRMNIVREGADSAGTNEVAFVRVLRGEVPKRVITLIRFPRTELLDDSERLRDLDRYLG